MECVILAGGLGTRIASISGALPKALVPVAGLPFAHHQLTLLASRGIRRVVYCIGHLGEAIRDYVKDGARFGLSVEYVDEGTALRGTAGALRLALDRGVLPPAFLVLYGDSYLPIDYAAVWAAFGRTPDKWGLMTVFRNHGRWDASNILFEEDEVVLYDKRRVDPRAAEMVYIDYGLTALRREAVQRLVEPFAVMDLADIYHQLSVAGRLGGFEVDQRFYEVGSPGGLRELEEHLERASGREDGG